ncbi:MAG: hypothetical protein ACK4NY_18295 [Spirosomataceae bacterium]
MGLIDFIKDRLYPEKKKFPYEKGGKMIAAEDAKRLIKKFDKDGVSRSLKTKKVLEAESFSLEAIASIIVNPECVGIRVYLGASEERPQILLVGIDEKGRDLVFDMTSLKDSGENSGVVADGSPCPEACWPPAR